MPDAPDAERLPYRLRGQFLSATELALFRSLLSMAEDRYVVCPKVALNDVFLIVRPNENVHYFNKIFRKHIDFLLCDREDMKPVFGVELVKPIARDIPREADQFMQDLFTNAGIPLVHVPSADRYDMGDLINLFQIALAKVKAAPVPDRASDSVPVCPVCGKMMVLRVHRIGLRRGQEYYGCMDNPHCPGVVEIRR
jgi:hypothetical protein